MTLCPSRASLTRSGFLLVRGCGAFSFVCSCGMLLVMHPRPGHSVSSSREGPFFSCGPLNNITGPAHTVCRSPYDGRVVPSQQSFRGCPPMCWTAFWHCSYCVQNHATLSSPDTSRRGCRASGTQQRHHYPELSLPPLGCRDSALQLGGGGGRDGSLYATPQPPPPPDLKDSGARSAPNKCLEKTVRRQRRQFFFYTKCLYSKYSKFCREFIVV